MKYYYFHIKIEDKVKPYKDDVFSIIKAVHDGYYTIEIDFFMFNRVLKIKKLTKDIKLTKYCDFIEYLISKKVNTDNILEEKLVEELAKEIDKQIIKDILKL
jgi:hypothetical protein